MFDLSYFDDNFFFGDDGLQSVFVYQLTFKTIELKEGKVTEYVICWESKGVYTSTLIPLYTAFLNKTKHFG